MIQGYMFRFLFDSFTIFVNKSLHRSLHSKVLDFLQVSINYFLFLRLAIHKFRNASLLKVV